MENLNNIEDNNNYEQIANELFEMRRVDQEMRAIVSEHIHDGRFNEFFDKNIDIENTIKLKEIVKNIGWPTISNVGKNASNAAWLLVQHADHDTEFQKDCLSKMISLPESDINPRNIAYLDDRIKTREGVLQLYGTQVRYKEDKTAELFPVFDVENLNNRRAEKGMEPIEDYLKNFE